MILRGPISITFSLVKNLTLVIIVNNNPIIIITIPAFPILKDMNYYTTKLSIYIMNSITKLLQIVSLFTHFVVLCHASRASRAGRANHAGPLKHPKCFPGQCVAYV